jgi:hypothetical protein
LEIGDHKPATAVDTCRGWHETVNKSLHSKKNIAERYTDEGKATMKQRYPKLLVDMSFFYLGTKRTHTDKSTEWFPSVEMMMMMRER